MELLEYLARSHDMPDRDCGTASTAWQSRAQGVGSLQRFASELEMDHSRCRIDRMQSETPFMREEVISGPFLESRKDPAEVLRNWSRDELYWVERR